MIDMPPADTFVGLLASELSNLKLETHTLAFHAGQQIFRQGDQGDGLYVVQKGEVEISITMDGQESRVLSRLASGTFFGEMAILDDQPRSATATALVDTAATFIARGEILRALGKSPRLLSALLREFSLRVRLLDHRFLDEILQAERLALVGRFAQSIVHDFKNPLNIIAFAADLAADENTSGEIRAEARTQIQRQATRMTNMINELLDFTRGSSRSAPLQPADYATFVRELLQEIRDEAGDKSVKIECEVPPPSVSVAMDRGRLQQVFYNLINNAIDVMPSGGTITLRFAGQETEVFTELEDTGPGFAPEIESRLFLPFATHGKQHGTGLGLSICKRIIEDHGGRIQAHCKPGRGAIFSIHLPCSAQ
ncbi:MAG TPA: ATP-binding protein [Chthoniobacter sp.]|jgi:signal transduction histidine kinase